MKLAVIVTAGGSSSRYGKINKLLEKINGREVILYSIDAFLVFNPDEIVISVSESLEPEIKNLIANDKILSQKVIKTVRGGDTRQASVYNALKACDAPDLVAIHDAARPLVQSDDIKKCIQKAVEYKAAIVAVKAIDTIKKVDDFGKIIETPERSSLWYVQTPQIFAYDLILDAHKKLAGESFSDDAGMLESLGVDVYISEGSYSNLKITTKKDIFIAQTLYSELNCK